MYGFFISISKASNDLPSKCIATEFYRVQGMPFDITSSTQFDQAYIHGRDIFDSISRIVDTQFNDYIVRRGHVEPLFASYCSGRTVTCRGLSQWGSFHLAQQGFTPLRILENFYGNDIDLVFDAPVGRVLPSYPGRLMRRGSSGEPIRTLQTMLRRISRNFPAIPAPQVNTGVFDGPTEAAVRTFQRVFGLMVDGIVGPITWNRARALFNGVKRLNELDSEGMRESDVATMYGTNLRQGDRGIDVRAVQYYLRFFSKFIPAVPRLAADGIFGPITDGAVRAFQRANNLAVDGIVGRNTFNRMVSEYTALYNRLPAAQRRNVYPGYAFSPGDRGQKVRELQTMLHTLAQRIPELPDVTVDGDYGPATARAVSAFQYYAQLPVSGDAGILTWNAVRDAYEQPWPASTPISELRFAALEDA